MSSKISTVKEMVKYRTEVFQRGAEKFFKEVQHGVGGSFYWNPFLLQVLQPHRGHEVQPQLQSHSATCEDAQAGPSSLLWHLPSPRLLLLLSPPLLTGIPLVMVQAQGRSPLAWHKFLCRLAGRRRRHRSFTAWALQGELPALLGSSLAPGSSPGK